MKYFSALTLALAATVTLASATPEPIVALPPGQGRSSRGVRSVITGHKIRSHVHHSRRKAAHDDSDSIFERSLSNATLNADDEETLAVAAAHKKRNTCSTKSASKGTSNYRASNNKSSSASVVVSDEAKVVSDSDSSSASSSADAASSTSSKAGSASASKSAKSSSSTAASTSNWKLVKSYAGSSFFDDMDFYTAADPTHGSISYVNQAAAQGAGLIGTSNGQAQMKISASNGWGKSVRISTKDSFTTGVFILDAEHMPVGCGVWPAWWSTPSNPSGGWPHGGEIDIIEGVNDYSLNTYSVHTTEGCYVPSNTKMSGKYTLSGSQGTNCASADTGNQGCGVTSTSSGDFGVKYNANGGGVHAMYWSESEGISTYFFAKGSVPDDISSGSPDPSSWGTPMAHWPATSCNIGNFFYNHVVVFTNSVCGDWAGSSSVWNNAMNGQSKSCQASTGKSSCSAYLASNPDMSEAYWTINSLKIYQTSRRS